MTTVEPAADSLQQVDDLEPAIASAILEWTLALADSKHRIGMRTSEWINGTPALEGAVGAAAITQDELGHARSYFSMLRTFPGAPDAIGFENDLEARDDYFNPRILNTAWESWLDVIAVNVLLDRALSIAVQATVESAYAPLRTRAAKILQEEAYHRIFGDSWLVRLAARGDQMTLKLQDSLNRFWLTAVAWFGPDDDPVTATLVAGAILNATSSQMRAGWYSEVEALLAQNGFQVPTAEPIWASWEAAYRDSAG